jgi:hypothetical protein
MSDARTNLELLLDEHSLDSACAQIADRQMRGNPAAQSTVDALLYEFRTKGAAALEAPNCQRRLASLSTAQVGEVIEALDRLRPKYPAITDDLLLLLAELEQ